MEDTAEDVQRKAGGKGDLPRPPKTPGAGTRKGGVWKGENAETMLALTTKHQAGQCGEWKTQAGPHGHRGMKT